MRITGQRFVTRFTRVRTTASPCANIRANMQLKGPSRMKHLFAALCLLAAFHSHAQTAAALRADIAAPELASVHAIIADFDTGATLFAKQADAVVPIASLTKLMMAMVVLDAEQPLGEWLKIVPRDTPIEKNAYSRLRIGSEATRRDLLHIALMSSENLACHVLAANFPGGTAAFVAAMNAKAAELGMSETRFVDSSGLSPSNRSTAGDLVKMATAATGYDLIREFSTSPDHAVRFRAPAYTLGYVNTNVLARGDGWDIVLSKTGFLNEAGRCLIMVATVGERAVTMVLLDSFGTRSPVGDAGRIKRWIETGSSGTVAGAAHDYERQRTAAYQAGRPVAPSPKATGVPGG
jgi:D-alanyl-D-alanine endopeptidase (penicillin-binding protein 7)